MKETKNNLYSAVGFLAFGIFVYATSNLIQPTTSDILGSRFFPRAVSVIICLLSLFQIVTSAMKLKALKAAGTEEEADDAKSKINRPLVLTVVLLFAYYILIVYFGFLITSILYLLAQSAILMSKEDFADKKKVIIMIAVAIIVPIFIKTVFWNVFSIALPSGKLF